MYDDAYRKDYGSECEPYITIMKICAADARARRASRIAGNNKTSENFEKEAKLWEIAAPLLEKAELSKTAAMTRAKAALARAQY